METVLQVIEEVTGTLTPRRARVIARMNYSKQATLLEGLGRLLTDPDRRYAPLSERSQRGGFLPYSPTRLAHLDDPDRVKDGYDADRPWSSKPLHSHVVLPNVHSWSARTPTRARSITLLLYAESLVIDDPISGLLRPAHEKRSIEDEAYHAREAVLASLMSLADLRPLIVADRLRLAPYRDRYYERGYGFSFELIVGILRELATDDPELQSVLDANLLPHQEAMWVNAALQYVAAQLMERAALGLNLDFFLPLGIHQLALQAILRAEKPGSCLGATSRIDLPEFPGGTHVASALAHVPTPKLDNVSASEFVDLIESEHYISCRTAVGRAMSRVSAEVDPSDRHAGEEAAARLEEEILPAFQELGRRSSSRGSARAAASNGLEALVFGAIPTVTSAAMGAPPASVGVTASATGAAAAARFCWSLGRGRALARHGHTAKKIASRFARPVAGEGG